MTIPLLWVVLLVIVAVLVTAAITAGLLGRATVRSTATATPRERPEPALPQPVEESGRAGGVRREAALVEGLIGAHDLAGSTTAVGAHIEQVLRGVGIELVVADPGAQFDPETQLVIDTEANGAEGAGTVLRQVRPGWRSDNGLLRPTEVVVWTR